jgi:hypothetical protein
MVTKVFSEEPTAPRTKRSHCGLDSKKRSHCGLDSKKRKLDERLPGGGLSSPRMKMCEIRGRQTSETGGWEMARSNDP